MTNISSFLGRAAAVLTVATLAAAPVLAQHAPAQAGVSAPAASHAPSAAKHMLYRAHGPKGATVYLLGSVHLLTPEAATLPAEVDSAFARAKTIAFEVSLDSMMMRSQELLLRGRYANGATLRSSLSPGTIAKLDSILPAYGLTLDQVNGFKPWVVALVLAQQVMAGAHFQPQLGVDAQLNARARTTGKPVMGLETVDFQLGLFDSLSPADQEKMLLEERPPAEEAKDLAKIKDAWLAGDAAGLDSLLNSRMTSAPGLLATLLTNRNRSWIPKIETMLQGSDDALVVVGAGHLVGKQGVVEMLRAKGYTVEQM
ncbi:MAG TPA: TraB/GumN family protein [Gemmatimonadales bacterium]|nr:TraB/GumN family protein [Gemmatimonadales bacterium]